MRGKTLVYRPFKIIGFRENEKLAPQNFEKMQNRHLKIWNWITIWNFRLKNQISKIQNRFLKFLINLASRPKNLKSAMSKTPKPSFSFQNSYFPFKFFFDQNLDFVLGSMPRTWCAPPIPVMVVTSPPPLSSVDACPPRKWMSRLKKNN